eukprot:TRINITY_DN61231_c0_g1_i1.p1 TRINITY_DN61231_c0_g1~~TRINITY_DN61231_c0_g1_i1.p1  ORF type:complete len:426 (-),score=106.28 TRINITY_DN61231_c0_g1_i1:23-1300(-)
MSKGCSACFLSLPECVLCLLELLDAQGLAQLRRTSRLGICKDGSDTALARAMRVAELRSAVLERLASTKFPFVHAAYVLGLNGPYYSVDTATERHYGIPAQLPRLLCDLFRLEKPDVAFTTLRIQKFASAANFNGNHRTLPINLHTPPLLLPDQEEQRDQEQVQADGSVPAFVLCFTSGCSGGFGEICEGEPMEEGSSPGRSWRCLAKPAARASNVHWAQFPVDTWLRWYWPTSGEYYAVTVTCEPSEHLRGLRARQRRQMLRIGFQLPSPWGLPQEDDSEEDPCEAAETDSTAKGEPQSRRGAVRLSSARLTAAKRLLGLTDLAVPSSQEIETAYRHAVRRAHPDRAMRTGTSNSIGAGWDMAQLSWARTVLREAEDAAAEAAAAGESPAWAQDGSSPLAALEGGAGATVVPLLLPALPMPESP